MLAACLGLLLVGSGVSLHLEEHAELRLEEATALAHRLARAIEARTGRRTVLDDPLWPDCRDADRCLDAIRARTDTEDVVLLRFYSGPTKIRLIAERLAIDSLRDGRLETNVPKDPDQARDEALENVAFTLFPEAPMSETSTQLIERAPTEEETGALEVLGWTSIAVAGASLAVAVGFGVSSRSVRNALLSDAPADDEEFNSAFDQLQLHTRVANALFITSAASLVLGGVFLLLD